MKNVRHEEKEMPPQKCAEGKAQQQLGPWQHCEWP